MTTAAGFLGLALALAVLPLVGSGSERAAAADPPTASVTVDPHDLLSGNHLEKFTYLINEDNAHLGNAPALKDRPMRGETQSYSPIAAEGDETNATVALPSDCTGKENVALDGHGCRYLISVRAEDHQMWGKHIALPADAGTVRINLSEASAARPAATSKLRVFVFNDDAWANAAPDTEEIEPGGGMGGFHVDLYEQTGSQVSVDYHNRPLCSNASGSISGSDADCTTQSDGFVQINDLSPARYFIDVTAPNKPCDDSNPDSHWVQTTTFDGGLSQFAGLEQGSDGSGVPGDFLWETPNRRTGFWVGFVCAPMDFADPGTGSISGTAVNWQGFPPFDQLKYDEDHPVDNPYVALTDAGTDRTVYVGRGDAQGNINIQGVPAGDYTMSIWDEQLSYIIRFLPVTVDAGQETALGDIGVSRWFGWLDGTVYKDTNGNGKFDDGADTPVGNTDMDERWPDGSIKAATFTDSQGHYEYPTAEGGALGKWFINEQGFARFTANPGPSLHNEIHPNQVSPSCAADSGPVDGCLPTDLGGALLTNQLIAEGHQATVDWGKENYPTGTPGQIVGVTYFATTRNEFDARNAAHEDYEPAIPNVLVRLESATELGPDLKPGTGDEPAWDPKFILNEYVTDKWHRPGVSRDGQDCTPGIIDMFGNPVTGLNPDMGPDCLETPLVGEQTKDGAFDGGYAFADYCPNGFDESAPNPDTEPCLAANGTDHTAPAPLVAGKYITHVVMPRGANGRACNPTASTIGKQISDDHTGGDNQGNCLYRIEREEDINVDSGTQFQPAIPPPACVGDPHKLDQATLTSRSTFYTGDQSTSPSRPLCDMRMIDLQNQQNFNADFFLETNFTDTVLNPDIAPSHPDPVGNVEEPGRVIGAVFDDVYFDRDPQSVWYGEPRPIGNIPVGIYGVDSPAPGHDVTPDQWRLITTVTTDGEGAYEALLPSTETFNCPIPQGPCPGMYIVKVNDPGPKGHPNPNYNPAYTTESASWDVWPGQTDVDLDTPLVPTSSTTCMQTKVDSTGTVTSNVPELLQVRKVTDAAGAVDRPTSEQGPFVRAGDSGNNRRVAIEADFIGPAGLSGVTGGHVVLTDQVTGAQTTLTRANGGILSWAPSTSNTSTPDRIVIQVPPTSGSGSIAPGPKQLDIVTSAGAGAQTSSNGITLHVLGGTYTPSVVKVPPPTPTGHELQSALDAAPANSLLVLSPGVYRENVVMWKPLKLQGLGPGGLIGSHELQTKQPDDARFNIQGSLIDGRFLQDNQLGRQAVVNLHAPYAGVTTTNPVINGGDITVLAQSTTAYGSGLGAAQIDGIGLQLGEGDGAGGIQLQAYANNMRITNNLLDSNHGTTAGGIGLGQPFLRNSAGNVDYSLGSHNNNVRIRNNRLYGNGGLTNSGAIGLFEGSDNYDVGSNFLCGNFGFEYGAGISQWGRSPGGSIHDNSILYNDAVDSGAGIAISDQTPPADATSLGQGAGNVDIDRNLIQGNFTGDDGGGMFIANTLAAAVNVRNNMIVDNGAADMGGGITLDDASNVAIVNNTVANNVSTGTATTSRPLDQGGVRHSAGLASEANDPRNPVTARFSNPVALFNNVFWQNEAFLLDTAGPGATLVSQGNLDFEVHDTGFASDVFRPRYSLLTNGSALNGAGATVAVPAGQGNTIGGAGPAFADPFTLTLRVTGSRLDAQRAAVEIVGDEPGNGIPGDYHLTAGSAEAIDRGVRCALMPFPTPNNALASCTGRGLQAPLGTNADIDGQWRPMQRTTRNLTPWDLGADELLGIPVTP
jgi:hypothetical protein